MAAQVTSSGVVILTDDARVYIRKVTGGFGGYMWSFAKGKIADGLSVEDNALKELKEEMGLEARIVGVLGDYAGTTGTTRFFIGVMTGGDTASHGRETEEVRLATREEAEKLLNMPNDRQVLEDLYRWGREASARSSEQSVANGALDSIGAGASTTPVGPAVGKIERVPLREIWSHEAHDFTVWLEENHDVLSDSLGLSIVSIEREQSAGSFSVDLLGQDDANRTIVIENQLERSDHDHLGKLITYAAFFDARVAVWIVAESRPEHVAAVAWLNQSSPTDFYLLKLEGIRIADSPAAPLLTLIVGPSQESREGGEVKKERAERQELLHRFWSQLLAKAKATTNLFSGISPSEEYWISTGVGMTGLSLTVAVRRHDGQAEIYIDRGSGKDRETAAIFDGLLAQRDQIETTFGGPLEWQPLPGKRARRIRAVFAMGGYLDEHAWPQLQGELIDAAVRLATAIKPAVANLNI